MNMGLQKIPDVFTTLEFFLKQHEQNENMFITGDNIPRMNIYINEKDQFVIEASVSGLDQDRIAAEIDSHAITLKYDPEEVIGDQRKYMLREIPKRRCMRKILLPDSANTDSAVAKIENGMLVIVIDLEHKKRTLSITAPDGQ